MEQLTGYAINHGRPHTPVHSTLFRLSTPHATGVFERSSLNAVGGWARLALSHRERLYRIFRFATELYECLRRSFLPTSMFAMFEPINTAGGHPKATA